MIRQMSKMLLLTIFVTYAVAVQSQQEHHVPWEWHNDFIEQHFPQQGQETAVGELGPFVPTPMEIVEKMLEFAEVKKDDVVCDLGCGDGRIVVMAAQKYGARGIGVDIDKDCVREALEKVKQAKVEKLVTILHQDAFVADLRDVTVLTLYILPSAMPKILPKLMRELKPGVRIVSHDYEFGDWQEDKFIEAQGPYRKHKLYLWIVPAGAAGIWRWKEDNETYTLRLRQKFQKVSGVLTNPDGSEVSISEGKIQGERIRFSLEQVIKGQKVKQIFDGKVVNHTIKGAVEIHFADEVKKKDWIAHRIPFDLTGTWKWTIPTPTGKISALLKVKRKKDQLIATCVIRDHEHTLDSFFTLGAEVSFNVRIDPATTHRYRGFVEGDKIKGTVTGDGLVGDVQWEASKVK